MNEKQKEQYLSTVPDKFKRLSIAQLFKATSVTVDNELVTLYDYILFRKKIELDAIKKQNNKKAA